MDANFRETPAADNVEGLGRTEHRKGGSPAIAGGDLAETAVVQKTWSD
jgi:hypothetical protein